jgi:hypothetical protein
VRRAERDLERRRSSVVERVIGNDEVDSSILSGGTIKSDISCEPVLRPNNGRLTACYGGLATVGLPARPSTGHCIQSPRPETASANYPVRVILVIV